MFQGSWLQANGWLVSCTLPPASSFAALFAVFSLAGRSDGRFVDILEIGT